MKNQHAWSITSHWFSRAAVSVVLCQLCASWISLCGASAASILMLFAGIVAGLILSEITRSRISETEGPAPGTVLVHAIAGLTTLIGCWLQPAGLDLTLLAGSQTFSGLQPPLAQLSLLYPALIVMLVTALVVSFHWLGHAARIAHWETEALWIGAGASFILGAVVLTIPLAAWSTAFLIPAIAVPWFAGRFKETAPPSERSSDQKALTARRTADESLLTALFFVCGGLLVFGSTMYLTRLMLISVPVLLVAVSSASLMLVVSVPRCRRPLPFVSLTTCTVLLLSAGVWQPEWVASKLLELTTHLPSAVLIIAVQGMLTGLLFGLSLFPAAALSWTSASLFPSNLMRLTRMPSHSISAGIQMLLGGFVAIILASFHLSPTRILATGIMILAILLTARPMFLQTMRSRASVALSALGLVASVLPWTSSDSSLTQVSSWVFSERTQAALRKGIERELIPHSDASRLIAAAASAAGEMSIWRTSGDVLEFRRNGVPVGRVSLNTEIAPQPAEDLLPAILGLVSHPQPGSVLIIGDDTGVCLRTCTRFPVHRITAIRPDAAATHFAEMFTWNSPTDPPHEDSRVTIIKEPPQTALRRGSMVSFDVVICAASQPFALSGPSELTQEFNESVHSCMGQGGFFCQRIRQSQLGPVPLQQSLATLGSVFQHAGAIQTIPGEILLIATDSDRGLIDPAILSRLQRDHVRLEIASAGWDWAQIAALPLVDAGDRIGMFSKERPRAISISNSHFVFSLPVEITRTANKSEELRSAFAPHQMQLAAVVPDPESHEEAKRRISGVNQEIEIMAGMPDQPWTYRKSLRMEMQRSPRPPIETVQDGRILKHAHPLDEQRKNYFIQLGKALTAAVSSQPDAVSLIRDLEPFAKAGEPLMSHFAHYEIVRLLEMTHHPDLKREFEHRMHIVFFAGSSDASVRPVISTIDQLVKHPELIPSSGERYDRLNSLIQKLVERWETRTAWEPRSAIRVQNDVDLSVQVTKEALNQMEQLAPEIGVSPDAVRLRRRFIHAALISPLRNYRDQVLAHRMKTETQSSASDDDPDDMPLLVAPAAEAHTN